MDLVNAKMRQLNYKYKQEYTKYTVCWEEVGSQAEKV